MTKMIEKVAEAIKDESYYSGSNVYEYYDHEGCHSTPERLAKAAIEALDIIVLDKDAEPEVGDVITYTAKEEMMDGSTKYNKKAFYKRKGAINFDFAEKGTVRIIQRNNRAVIYSD